MLVRLISVQAHLQVKSKMIWRYNNYVINFIEKHKSLNNEMKFEFSCVKMSE
jgi:hypothetical protein